MQSYRRRPYTYRLMFMLGLFLLFALEAESGENSLKVTATAYNSHPEQTQGNPLMTAWGDKLVPGIKAIAVSLDLIRMGLTRGVKVKIEGLPGTYIVMDKMHERWVRRIDIYMGKDVKAAKKWGKRKVMIRW